MIPTINNLQFLKTIILWVCLAMGVAHAGPLNQNRKSFKYFDPQTQKTYTYRLAPSGDYYYLASVDLSVNMSLVPPVFLPTELTSNEVFQYTGKDVTKSFSVNDKTHYVSLESGRFYNGLSILNFIQLGIVPIWKFKIPVNRLAAVKIIDGSNSNLAHAGPLKPISEIMR